MESEPSVVESPIGQAYTVRPPNPLEKIKNVHTLLQLADGGQQPPKPYVIAHRRPNHYMVCIGLDHAGDDPGHHNYAVLRKEWQQFLQVTDGWPRIALYEGRKVGSIPKNESSALTLGREAPLIAYWAKRDSVPSMPGEPSRREIGAHLLDRFDPSHVYYFYLARQLSQYPRMRKETRPSLTQYLQQTYDSFYIPLRKWEHFKSTRNRLLGGLAIMHETIFNQPFDPNDTSFFAAQLVGYTIDPLQQSPIQKVSAECNAYRDLHLVDTYSHYMAEGVSVFDARGLAHIYGMDNYIRALGHSGIRAVTTANGLSLRDCTNANLKIALGL